MAGTPLSQTSSFRDSRGIKYFQLPITFASVFQVSSGVNEIVGGQNSIASF